MRVPCAHGALGLAEPQRPVMSDPAAEGLANKTTTLAVSKPKQKKPALYTTKGRSAAGDFSAGWYQEWLMQTCASIGQIIQAHGEDTPTVHVDKVGDIANTLIWLKRARWWA